MLSLQWDPRQGRNPLTRIGPAPPTVVGRAAVPLHLIRSWRLGMRALYHPAAAPAKRTGGGGHGDRHSCRPIATYISESAQ
eukprot:scaffold3713_cov372-Prasinococcus_capsulatus_cf.AAC.30